MVKKINAIERVPVIRRGICSFAFNITSRHDEIYSDFFLFRAQKRGILKKVRFLPQEAIPKAKGLWSFALGIVLSPRLCGDNLPIFKSKRLHQIGVTPANAGKNCKTLCVSSIPFSRVTHIFK